VNNLRSPRHWLPVHWSGE